MKCFMSLLLVVLRISQIFLFGQELSNRSVKGEKHENERKGRNNG